MRLVLEALVCWVLHCPAQLPLLMQAGLAPLTVQVGLPTVAGLGRAVQLMGRGGQGGHAAADAPGGNNSSLPP